MEIYHHLRLTNARVLCCVEWSLPDGYRRVIIGSVSGGDEEGDAERLLVNRRQLNDSSFYVAELSSTDARRRLRSTPPGTFVVRDSAHPSHLYSLTVRTPRSVTSIRTVYERQRFRLDSDPQRVRNAAGIPRGTSFPRSILARACR